MNTKLYEFSYGSSFRKFISKMIMLICNAFIGCLILFLVALIIAEINFQLRELINNNVLDILVKIEVYSGIVFYLCIFILPSFFKQKVVIDDNIIKVYRYCFINLYRGFNDYILINKIEKICIEKNHSLSQLPHIMPVAVIDWDNLVRIEMETGILLFYIPVKNAEDFIDDVTERINKYRRENGLEEI